MHDIILFVALFPAHGLPSATTDETCCALLAQAYARYLYRAQNAATNATEVDGKDKAVDISADSTATRGLLAITSELWRTFRKDLESPTKQGFDLQDSAKSMISRRESGFTQSPVVESLWVTHALQDVVRALHMININKATQEFSDLLSHRLQRA